MGIDINLYRQRIGLFGPGRGYRAHCFTGGSSSNTKVASSEAIDFSYRLLVTFLTIGTILLACRFVMPVRDIVLSHIASKFSTDYFCIHAGLLPCHAVDFPESFRLFGSSTLSETFTYCNSYAEINERLLLLSADVETNPGPLSESEQTLLEAIKSNEARVLAEISEVKSEMTIFKTEIAQVKTECAKTKSEIDVVKRNQAETDKHVNRLKSILKPYKMKKKHYS